MRRLAITALAAAALVAAAFILLSKLPGFELPGLPQSSPSASSAAVPVYVLQLSAGEGGLLLVNGSAAQGSVVSGKPFTVFVEAVPSRCYKLKQLLVNGTPFEGSRAVLRVSGNTTVAAVFERVCVLVRFEVFGDGNFFVNGSSVHNGSEVEVPPNSTLMLRLEASELLEGLLYVNDTIHLCPACSPPCPGCPPPPIFITVRGDTKLSAVFEPRIVALHIDTGGLPALISSGTWQQQVNGTATIGVRAGSIVNITTFCRPEGEEHFCVLGWCITYTTRAGLVNTTTPPNITLHVTSDTTLKAYTAKVKGLVPPPAKGAVLLNGKEVPATMHPNPFEAFKGPLTTRFEYIGNGTWLIDEPTIGSLFIELPESWSKAVVEVWVDYWYGGIPIISVDVVVSEYPWQQSVGRLSSGEPLKPGAYFRIVFTRSGEVLETPEKWWPLSRRWVIRNPLAKEGWLYIIVAQLMIRVKVTLQP